jgi:hypothetical protein
MNTQHVISTPPSELLKRKAMISITEPRKFSYKNHESKIIKNLLSHYDSPKQENPSLRENSVGTLSLTKFPSTPIKTKSPRGILQKKYTSPSILQQEKYILESEKSLE